MGKQKPLVDINDRFERVPVDAIRPHPNNPRRGDVGMICQAIAANGFYGTIVVQKSTGHILAGNHRWKAAVQAGPDFVKHCESLLASGFEQRNTIIWAKSNFPISRGHYTVQHEPCIYAVRRGRKSYWIGDKSQSTLWKISLDQNVAGGHSTQKPLECMARPIRNHEGEVYEPFCGSGTTLVAAEQLSRGCYAIEINPAYVAIALERMESLGITPRLVTDD